MKKKKDQQQFQLNKTIQGLEKKMKNMSLAAFNT